MKNHSAALLSFLLLLLPVGLLAQELPNIVPPSPEAASLGKFTEVPISHYTGLPNISVPIASYEVGGKSFPVGLSYHARGVRVEEIASRVGIGWALNAGGAISRQTRHVADDGLYGYFSNTLIASLADETWFSTPSVRSNYQSSASSDPDRIDKTDRVPDQFSIQAGSVSAKFIFDYKDGEPLIQKFDDIRISYNDGINSSKIESFIVTDSQGFKYYFGISKPDQYGNIRSAQNWDRNLGSLVYDPINGANFSSNSTPPDTYNTWHLMDVESPSGELVSFYYELETSIFYRRSYDQEGSGNVSHYSSKVESRQYQLKEIQHSGGKIVLYESNLKREDLKNSSFALDSISVHDHNDTFVKGFKLNHSYSEDTSSSNVLYYLYAQELEAAKRLFLDSVVEYGNNNTKKPPYVFSYNPEPLPNRFSNSQDYWGFYNGAQNGQYLTFSDYSGNNVGFRRVDLQKSMAGILEKITYPTGGSTKFIYEHNRGVLGAEFNDIYIHEINPIDDFTITLGHLQGSYNGDYFSKPLTIGQNTVSLIESNIWLDNNNFRVYVKNVSTLQEIDLSQGVNNTIVPIGNYNLIVDPLYSNYDPAVMGNGFGVTLNWIEELADENDLLYASGKRIQRIEFYDSGNNLVSNKSYTYETVNGTSSGVILGLSAFNSINRPLTTSNFTVFDPLGTVSGSPLSTYQGNTIGYSLVTEYHGNTANNIGKTIYTFTEHRDTGGNLSFPYHAPTDNEWLRGLPKSVTIYRKEANNTYTQVKSILNKYLWGDDFINGAPAIIPEIFTPDSFRSDISLNSIGAYIKTNSMYRLPLVHMYYASAADEMNGNAKYKTYYQTGGTLDKIYTTETTYDETGQLSSALVTESESSFNYDKHYKPAKVTSVTSDGEPVIQTFTYAQDLLSPSYINSNPPSPVTIEDKLDFQNRIVPLEVKTFKDANNNGVTETTEQTSFTKTIFKDWGSGILEPEFIQTAKGDNALKDRIEFKKYDADGNILQVSKTDGMDICYIYGYKNALPVAKIENAIYANVQPFANGVQNASNSDNTSCMASENCNENALRTAQTNLRNGLPNAMVTTYTYDPLVGVTSMTDPNGYTVYYEYDDLHRLVRVKDEDGKIMSENKYHYLLDN